MSSRGSSSSRAVDRMSSGLRDRPDSMPQLLNEIATTPLQNCQRMVLLGSAKVGKTAIVSRFLSNCFDDKYTPTIEDFHRKVYRIRGESYRLDILDTSGNNPFPAMKRLSLLTGYLLLVLLIYFIPRPGNRWRRNIFCFCSHSPPALRALLRHNKKEEEKWRP